ncbi:hypothetical protein PybrP1_003637 [[Pythium] brassicae (nom. inval.)]|nr:hypothetical protein PybrP1_003637 [[Pythium] brassicae (nom. inval.)]
MAPSSPPPLPAVDMGASAFAAAQPQLLAALSGVHQLCLAAKDRQNASLQLHARLHQVFLRLAAAAARGSLSPAFSVAAFASLLARLRRALEQHVRLKNAVLRLLASRRLLGAFRQLHHELSALVTQWQLAGPASAALLWKPQLAVNVHLDEKTLRATLAALLAPTSSFVAKEFGGERRQLLVLLELVTEFAPERERFAAHSPELLETLKMVHRRIASATGVHVRRAPRWFLPRAEVVVVQDRHRGALGKGSFGSTLCRADYYGADAGGGSSGANPRPVVVKYLWPLRDVYYTQVEHLFARTLQQWWHINHPNVAQVHGASHVAAPPYIVRDYAAFGGLPAYVAAVQAHAKGAPSAAAERVTWELLYGAAKGLLYLHEQMKVVHGALRCSNILVTKRGQPVIADYGLRALAAEVARHSMQVDAARVDDSELARWLAPECLLDADGRRMCAFDPVHRLSLREVITEIKELGYFGYGNKPPLHAESPAPSADDEDTDADDSEATVPDSTPVGDSNAIVSDATSAAELAYQDDQGNQDADFLDLEQRSGRKSGDVGTAKRSSSSAAEPQAEESITLPLSSRMSPSSPHERNATETKQQEPDGAANIWNRLDEDTVVERISVRVDVAAKPKAETSSSAASTVEPELEAEAIDGLFFDARKANSDDDGGESSRATPIDEAPLSLTSEIRNRIRSSGRGGDRSSFLDNLLRATTLRTEYMTARETSDTAATPPPPLSTPKYVDLVEVLKGDDASADTVLQALQLLRTGVRLGKREVDWTERGGFETLFAVIERRVAAQCTYVALEILVESAVQNPGDIDAMVACGAVRILLAFLERSSASEELDLVASFLLEILASSDAAKHELWATNGISTVEANSSVDRRLVQEVKSIMAKFKSSEGYRHMNAGECDLAIERFSEAIALDRKRATYYCDRSLAYYEASLFKKAADDAARCMRYNPYDVIGYLRNGMALKALGRFNEAIVCLRKGRQVDPKFAKIRDVIAEIEDLRRGRSRENASEEASVSPEEIVKAKKKDGDDALRKKQYELAIRCYTEALAIDRRNDLLYLHRSIAHSGCGMFDKAIEDASRCIQINYRHSEGYYRLALALNSVGQYDQALRTLYRGQEVDSRHAAIRRFTQQLEQEEAKRAGLDLPAWFKEKGYQAFQLRAYEEAIKFYSKGIAASKSDHDDVALHCFFYRARANQCRGEFGAVVMDCTHILHHNPKNVFARLRRADAYEQQRDYFMALQDMQELVMFNPDFESARARLESLEVRCRFLPRTNLQHVL